MQSANSLRSTLESGNIAFGAQTVTHQPSIVEVYGDVGLDFVWIDFEHIGPAPYNGNYFEDLTRAADVSGTELLVRLPQSDPALIRKTLDAGVRNVLIPRIETADEVRRSVEASRFSYDGAVGERGIAASRASSWGDNLDDDYVRTEDQHTSVGVMIENETAVDNLDEILQVPELGFIMIGPADLSVSLGHPLEFDNPKVASAIDGIKQACKKHDVPIGMITSSKEETKEAVADGVQLIRINSGEIGAIRSQLTEQLDQLEELR